MENNKMKIFNWDILASQRNPAVVAWLKKHHKDPITLEQFIEAMQSLRDLSSHPKKAKRYAPSALKSQYKRLRTGFNFFPTS